MRKGMPLLQMKMPADISKYQNKWVALDLKREKVLVSGKTIKEVDKKAEKLTSSPDKYILSHIVDSKLTYSP